MSLELIDEQFEDLQYAAGQYLSYYGKQGIFFFFAFCIGSYLIMTNGALLRARARRGHLKSLCALTNKLVRRGDHNLKMAAHALINNARQGFADDMYSLAVRTGLPKDPFFKQDEEVSNLWKEQHDAFRGIVPVKGEATQVHAVTQEMRDPYEELNSLVGLEEVKKAMTDIANRAELFEKRKRAGLPVTHPALHLIFLGNPGTGKTTVARILGRLLWKIGYLTQGHVVEVSEGELIGQYIGETPIKVHKKIQQALGGILFIDEAYSILNANSDKGAFSSSAIATIVKFMEDFRHDLVVIAAGYPKEMTDFMESNPGLRSRFTEVIKFDDYDAKQMIQIFIAMAEGNHYLLGKDARTSLASVMEEAKRLFTHNFSNGRFVRNLFEDSITFLASRVARMKDPTREELMQISQDDITRALDKVKANNPAQVNKDGKAAAEKA